MSSKLAFLSSDANGVGLIRWHRRYLWLVAGMTLSAVVGCPETQPEPVDNTTNVTLEIQVIRAPEPAVAGSNLTVEARGIDSDRLDQTLELSTGGVSSLLQRALGDGALRFRLEAENIATLGLGSAVFDARLIEGDLQSAPVSLNIELAEALELTLTEVSGGSVFRNDEIVIRGSGLLSSPEGQVAAHLSGTFTAADQLPTAIEISLPVQLAEPDQRERGLVRLSSAIGGIGVGTFSGSMSLSSTLASDPSGSIAVIWEFAAPTIFGVAEETLFLGQVIAVQGGGFLGHPDDSDEATLLRFEGTFTDPDGLTTDFGPADLVAVFQSGQGVGFGIETETRGLSLVSAFFGADQGVFEGTVIPIVLSGNDELEGDGPEVRLELDGQRQVVEIIFLPSFRDSLRHFGLASAAAEVEAATIRRIQTIWTDYNLVIGTEIPDDVLESAVSRLEIGGPDPNGLGLLGYDNSPGKDLGNLRLFDTIGGANAETQADGFPGYGGVFIESFLYWSENPGLTGERPFGAPAPDPLFDQLFGVVRTTPATLAEVQGGAGAERVAAVEVAINGLGSMVGETSAHEIGHSLGLAQPFGPRNSFHTQTAAQGCLMDIGAERPLGERAQQTGFAETRFCENEAEYLGEILGR